MRLLSRSAHGWAVALIIDVVENLRRQETKLPAVPPIMTLSQKDGRQRQCILSPEPPPGMSRGELCPTVDMHTCTCIHTSRGYKMENHIDVHSQMDTSHTHTYTQTHTHWPSNSIMFQHGPPSKQYILN